MFYIFMFFLSLGGIAYLWWVRRKELGSHPGILKEAIHGSVGLIIYGVLGLVAFLSLLFTSVVIPNGNEIAVLDRVYFCTSIKDGRNVAIEGECGRQARIIMPGFKASLFIRVLNHVSFVDMVDVPDGRYAILVAKDGVKLDEGQVAAKPWPLGVNTFRNEDGKEVTGDMLDATFFLTDGRGRKGQQTTVLTPGRYPINPFLWDLDSNANLRRTSIPPGHVGYVRSAIDERTIPAFFSHSGEPVDCNVPPVERDIGQLKAVLVSVGCRGVWNKPLPTGEYYLNKHVYDVTPLDTRMQNWTYRGGYTSRVIDLTVGEDGSIHQQETKSEVPVDEKAAGEAIAVKVEGWTVHQELRLQARVRPEDAPLVGAAVGNLEQVEDRIITPQVRSAIRNVGGSRIMVKNTAAYEDALSEMDSFKARLILLKDASTDVGLSPEQRQSELAQVERHIANFQLPDPNREIVRPTRVLDFQNERATLERIVAEEIRKLGSEAGIEVVGVTFGNADIPPELLVARKIEQLSGQLRMAYTQMRAAHVQRQATEAAKARADQQKALVEAQIGVERSQLGIQQKQNEGTAERRFMEEQAKGQEAQAVVLGKDRVAMLRALEMLLGKPEILTALKLPTTMVVGSNGLEGLGAVLGGTQLFGGVPKEEVSVKK